MKELTTLLFLGFFANFVPAQSIERQVIGASGTNLTDGATAIVGFTVGELVTTTITDGTTVLAQGFHQGELVLSITINPIVFLQGAATNPNTGEENLMRDDLRVTNYIPLTSPYSDGLIADASVLTTVGTDAIVDWVWVELRDENDDSIIIDSQSALLQRDGDVVAIDGVSPLSFSLASNNYFVAVNHRNHLGVISATALALSTNTIIDLSLNEASVQGNSNGFTLLTNGKYGIFSGDYDANVQIQNQDVSAVIPLIGTSGYSVADMDINSEIQNTDVNNLIIPNIGRGQQYLRTSTETISSSASMAIDIHFTFANAQITNDGANDFYEVDVLIVSTEDFKLGSGQFYLTYNIAAFGTNVSANGKIEYSQPVGSILGEVYGFPAYKDFIQNDNTSSRISLSFQQGVSSGTITANNVSGTPKMLCHIKIEYVNSSLDPDVCFETQPVFIDQFFTACGPSAVGFPDCTNEPGMQILNDTFDCTENTLSVDTFVSLNITMYPNPTKSMFYIKGLQEKSTLSIYDLNGRLVLQQNDYLDKAIDISQLQSAMYLVKISNSKGVSIKQLLKW